MCINRLPFHVNIPRGISTRACAIKYTLTLKQVTNNDLYPIFHEVRFSRDPPRGVEEGSTMAGRFFATGDTDTESSSESSDEEIPKANLGAIRLY